MDLPTATRKAGQILDQERAEPTLKYGFYPTEGAQPHTLPASGLGSQFIYENPSLIRFESLNFTLLCALSAQVAEADRPKFSAALSSRLGNRKAYLCKHSHALYVGRAQNSSSELPLVAEFLVRTGYKQLFFDGLARSAPSPGLTLCLRQVGSMISFNFTLLTETEYEQLEGALAAVKGSVTSLLSTYRPSSTIEANTFHAVSRELPDECVSVSEQCRKARYLYLKGSLISGLNLEVNQDKDAVRGYLEKLGFSQILIGSLEEAEKEYRDATTTFELKNSMGHLRSFLEELHSQACALVHKGSSGALPAKWGETHRYLREHGLQTPKEEEFVTSLYTLLSDTGIHPLITEKEYARLMRNMCIEYGLLLLTKLDKMGLKTQPDAS